VYLHHMDKSTRLGDAMRIGIEGKVLGWHGSGIGRYATSLTRALLREAVGRDKDCTFVIFTGPQTSQDALTGYQGAHYQHAVPFKSSLLRSLISLPLALRREHIDVFHGLDHIGIPLVGRYSRYVATIHDVIPLLFPHLFTVKHRWGDTCSACAHRTAGRENYCPFARGQGGRRALFARAHGSPGRHPRGV
jgi:glycosyltransferase involved in cell wall biosynthesis